MEPGAGCHSRASSRDGNYTSPPNDTDGQAYFGTIVWNTSLPNLTGLGIQLRGGDTNASMQAANFTGPDGTPDTFYNTSGQRINETLNGSRWIQYRVFFNSSEPSFSPLLESLRIQYNLLQNVTLTSPRGGEVWNGTHNITWNASDPDNSRLLFDIYVLYQNYVIPIETDISNATRSYAWDTTMVTVGTYRIRVVARDDNPEIPLAVNDTSADFTVDNLLNHPPIAILLSPMNQSLVNSSEVELRWSGSDSDGDPIFYFVFLVTSDIDLNTTPVPLPICVTNETSCKVTGLLDLTSYYWTVVPNDTKENGTPMQIWTFTVQLPENHPPEVTLLAPQDGTVFNTSDARLSWNATDADGDPLSYFVILSETGFDVLDPPRPVANITGTVYNATNLMNGTTYHWTVIPNDGRANGTGMTEWTFSILVIPPPGAPVVVDWAPRGDGNPVKPTILVEFDQDMDSQSVFSAIIFQPPVDVSSFVHFNTTFQVTLGAELGYNTTYAVTVGTTARSNAGTYLASPFRWNFTTILKGELDKELPTVMFTDPPDGASRVNNRKNITIMFSESMDRSATEQSVMFTPFADISIGWVSQKGYALVIIPLTNLSNGTYNVVVATSAKDESGNPLDGNYNGRADGAEDAFSFNFTVGSPPVIMVKVLSRSPTGKNVALNETVRLAFDRSMNRTAVRNAFLIDPYIDGCWTASADGKNLTFTPSKNFRSSRHYSMTLSAKAADINGNLLEKEETWSFTTVSATTGPSGAFPWWAVLAIVLAAGLGMAGYVYSMKRKAPETVSGEAGVKQKKREILAGADVPSATPALEPVPARFAILDLFLMYKDGRLMLHTALTDAGEDTKKAAGILKAVQDAATDSIAHGTAPATRQVGDARILFEKGKHLLLAAAVTGTETGDFLDEMGTTVRNIESVCSALLPGWDGTTDKLADAKKLLAQLGAFVSPESAPADVIRADVTAKGELEFHHGFVKLTVTVRNGTFGAITGASLKLMWNEQALRLDRVEPQLPLKGGTVALGTVDSYERKVLTFYLDPQICTESYAEGILTYKDQNGALRTAQMPRKLTSIVCPILYTDENINVAMLKRMVDEELPQKDTKVFQLPTTLVPEKGFDVAKSAVQHHDVKLVREFTESAPFVGEAWYFGKAKGRDDRIIIRARILAEKRMLEFFVASSSTLMLTGMLAELKTDLNKELRNMRMKDTMSQVTSQKEVDAVSVTMTLLEKASQAEKAAGGSGTR
jgi:hypothetical protein